MSKKLPVNELLRLACIYAEQDRAAFVAAHEGMEEDPACQKAIDYLKQLRAYRDRRWGKTALEAELDTYESVPVTELMKRTEGES